MRGVYFADNLIQLYHVRRSIVEAMSTVYKLPVEVVGEVYSMKLAKTKKQVGSCVHAAKCESLEAFLMKYAEQTFRAANKTKRYFDNVEVGNGTE